MYKLIKKIYYSLLRKKKQKYIQSLIQRGLFLGTGVEIVDTFFFDPSHCFLISIGNNCTICPNVRLVAHDASTKRILGYTKIGKITILENCFIGDSVVVLPNVTIGPNAIVGAGSIVTRDIPSNSVAAGNPARVISSLGDYIHKIESMSKDKRIFDKNYHIENMDEEKRREVIKSIADKIGFIE